MSFFLKTRLEIQCWTNNIFIHSANGLCSFWTLIDLFVLTISKYSTGQKRLSKTVIQFQCLENKPHWYLSRTNHNLISNILREKFCPIPSTLLWLLKQEQGKRQKTVFAFTQPVTLCPEVSWVGRSHSDTPFTRHSCTLTEYHSWLQFWFCCSWSLNYIRKPISELIITYTYTRTPSKLRWAQLSIPFTHRYTVFIFTADVLTIRLTFLKTGEWHFLFL